MNFRNFLEHFDNPVPPPPGTQAIPPGSLRLYHYINPRGDMTEDSILQTVKQEGLNIKRARGSTYGEPNVIWASTQLPHDKKISVEFAMPRNDPRWGPGFRPDDDRHLQRMQQSGADVYFTDSIQPQEIMAVHLPWHHSYHYLKDNGMIPRTLSGEFDYLLNGQHPDEAKAIEYIKRHKG